MQIEEILRHLGGFIQLGLFCALMGFTFAQIRSGFNKDLIAQKDSLIITLKENAVAAIDKAKRLEDDNKMITTQYQVKIDELTEKVGKVQGLYEGAEKRSQLLEAIFKGKSPDEEQYRKDMREFTKGVAKYMENSSKILEASSKKDEQTAIILKGIIGRLDELDGKLAGHNKI